MENKNQLTANLLLIGVTAVWGLTFVVVKNALNSISPFYFNAFRFTIAALFLLIGCCLNKQSFDPRLIKKGLLVGLFLFGGYSFQTIGLRYTTASNAGFITGLSVVIVPFLMFALYKKRPSSYALLGIVLATSGLGLLSLENNFAFNSGDLLILLCALCFAVHMVMVGHFISQFETIPFVTVQIATVAWASWVAGLLGEPFPPHLSGQVWLGLIITAIPATSLAYLIQNWAQKFTTPTHTALILAIEPVFSMLFAFLLLEEFFTKQDLLGAILMLIGMLLAEIKSPDSLLAPNDTNDNTIS